MFTILLSLALAATSANMAAPDGDGRPAGEQPSKPAKPKKICQKVEMTGSSVPKRVCRTVDPVAPDKEAAIGDSNKPESGAAN